MDKTAFRVKMKTDDGICGKNASDDYFDNCDKLVGALVGLARAADGEPQTSYETLKTMIECLSSLPAETACGERNADALISLVHDEKKRLAPGCAECASPCGRTADYDMEELWNSDDGVRGLKLLILLGLRGLAIKIRFAFELGIDVKKNCGIFQKALFAVGEEFNEDYLIGIAAEIGEKMLDCMKLIDSEDADSRIEKCRIGHDDENCGHCFVFFNCAGSDENFLSAHTGGSLVNLKIKDTLVPVFVTGSAAEYLSSAFEIIEK